MLARMSLHLVWTRYARMDARKLVNLTHKEGSPWWETRKAGRTEISPDLIQKHFRKLLRGNLPEGWADWLGLNRNGWYGPRTPTIS